ncbi:MAG: tRNA preQ1(34) S-adenosylmethionine ribosyltransferase-isomerase QueA [Bryobacterales bacterium]|nr:tRNA preQ1(34) S-adenosylmethionine ribosyltransferase-isomerase QueA [Bryobacterales bacterium]
MNLAEFQYDLPEDRIAQQPLEDRAASRMLVVYRREGRWEDRAFRDLPQFLHPGDCLVLNDSKVLPARLFGHREGFTGHIEVLLVSPRSDDHLTWLALARPGRKLRTREHLVFSEKLRAEIIGRGEFGERLIRFISQGDFYEAIAEAGHMPLPPYIHRSDTAADQTRYQTVYAREPGSVAAPTAGLHFTPEVLSQCEAAGAVIARVTLHVGLGTFQPLHTQVIEEVKLHEEQYFIPRETAASIQAAKRVVAVGTTSVRTVETAAAQDWTRLEGETGLFIYPGYQFRRVNAMVTNFHLPQSSLLVLVCAFGGKDLILEAYRHAVDSGYRFYSYGDAMLIV